MRIACLTRYGPLGASSRVRFEQYLGPLTRIVPSLTFERHELLDDVYLQRKYAGRRTLGATLRGYIRRALAPTWHSPPELWWLEKELWPFVPAAFEIALLRGRPYVLDLDDAIFHSYDRHRNAAVRRLFGGKIDRLMRGAALVTAGNDYLAARARAAGARWVEVLPTVVDLERYPAPSAKAHAGDPFTVGWIGSPATVHYLRGIAEPLRRLAAERPLRLVVVGAASFQLAGVEVQSVPWSLEGEVQAIGRFDAGVMPLEDSPWERGKCGYKLVQYMACGLPVVASPVGVNASIVRPGENGFLASDETGWYDALSALAGDAGLRRRLGAAGRQRVEAEYSLQVTAPRLAGWLQAVAARAAS